jgi:Rrf2 family protein
MLIPMKVDYGVRMLVYLAQQSRSDFASTADIAAARHIPEPYLLHICSELQKAGMIRSRRGPQGGHQLAVAADQITVSQVVDSLDYSLAPLDCVDDELECTLSGACAQREMWSDVEKILLQHLSSVTISELAIKEAALRSAKRSPVKFPAAARLS